MRVTDESVKALGTLTLFTVLPAVIIMFVIMSKSSYKSSYRVVLRWLTFVNENSLTRKSNDPPLPLYCYIINFLLTFNALRPNSLLYV